MQVTKDHVSTWLRQILHIKHRIWKTVSPAGMHPGRFYDNGSMCVWVAMEWRETGEEVGPMTDVVEYKTCWLASTEAPLIKKDFGDRLG